MAGGVSGPVVDSFAAPFAHQGPEDLGSLHHGVEVLGGFGFGAEDVLQPDPVIFFGVEFIFDAVSLAPGSGNGDDPFGREIGKIGDKGIEGGRLGSDFARQDNIGLQAGQHHFFDPSAIQSALGLAPAGSAGDHIGPAAWEQPEHFVPGGGLASFLEGEDVLPAMLLADLEDGCTAIEGIADPAQGQPGEDPLDSVAQAQERFEFAILLVRVRVVHVHKFMEEGEGLTRRPEQRHLQDIAITSPSGATLTIGAEALAALFLYGAVDQQDIPVVEEAAAVEQASFEQFLNHLPGNLHDLIGIDPAGMAFGIVGAGDGRLALKARVLAGLAAELAHVPGARAGVAGLVEGVAGASAEQINEQNVPPQMGGQIETHRLAARVGQLLQPVVEAGKGGADYADEALGDERDVERRPRFAARWFAL